LTTSVTNYSLTIHQSTSLSCIISTQTQHNNKKQTKVQQPNKKPQSPNFSTGPCKKYPTFKLDNLDTNLLGRSHRSKLAKDTIAQAIAMTHRALQIPSDYWVGIVPASDTGAVEIALWNLLGPKPVDVFSWESFSNDWQVDIRQQLQLPNVNNYSADYGKIPDLSKANADHDIVFTYNGTTSGVCVPNLDWIAADRQGLTICDATSAVFAYAVDWSKLDVATFSWQKAVGGEAAHGVLILSPRAVARLNAYKPPRPIPKIMRLTNAKGQVIDKIFQGITINTPSLLCIADYIEALKWVESIGGLPATVAKCDHNFKIIDTAIAKHDWLHYLVTDPKLRSKTSVCLTIDVDDAKRQAILSKLAELDIAYDINSYATAPAGVRIWCGPTIDSDDIAILMDWLHWAYLKL